MKYLIYKFRATWIHPRLVLNWTWRAKNPPSQHKTQLVMWEERIFPQSGIVRFGMSRVNLCPHPHGFAQSHIGERRLPPLPRPTRRKLGPMHAKSSKFSLTQAVSIRIGRNRQNRRFRPKFKKNKQTNKGAKRTLWPK